MTIFPRENWSTKLNPYIQINGIKLRIQKYTQFSTRLSRPFNRGEIVFSITVLGQWDILIQKKAAEPLPHIIYFQKRSKSLNVRATII